MVMLQNQIALRKNQKANGLIVAGNGWKDLAKGGLKALAPVAIDAGTDMLKKMLNNKLGGSGLEVVGKKRPVKRKTRRR
jgi:hypothetical protein